MKGVGKPKDTFYNGVNPTKLSTEVKKVIQQLLNDPEVMGHEISELAASSKQKYEKPKSTITSIPKEVSVSQGQSDGKVFFKWDPNACAPSINLSENSMFCFLMETGYCFRSVVGTTAFMGGIAYWEIHADERTENELKIGVVSKKNFNHNTVSVYCN